jgi:GT2 family glycosyltransferase
MEDLRPDKPSGANAHVSVVVVVYGEEPWLERCVASLLASESVIVDVVLVENGGSEAVIADLERGDRIQVVRPGRNTGFAEGCNIGVAQSHGDLIALINPDAIVEPDTLRLLCAAAQDPLVGIATGSIRLADQPDNLNSAGTVITVTGLSWSSHFGEPAHVIDTQIQVAGASGAGLVLRRSLWEEFGGFNESFFAYYEDAEISIRTHRKGLKVLYVPEAVVIHRYEFSRNSAKFFLLERNRAVTMLTCFSARHLVAIAPLLVVMELGLVALSIRHGWFSEKMRSYWWILRNMGNIRERRSLVQALATAPESDFLDLLSTSLTPGNLTEVHPPKFVEKLLAAYWVLARRFIDR